MIFFYFVTLFFPYCIVRSASIRNCGIAHSALTNLETLRNCVLRTTITKLWNCVLRTAKTCYTAHLWIPNSVHVENHIAEVNWVTLSVVTVAGTPKRATQLVMNATAGLHVEHQHGFHPPGNGTKKQTKKNWRINRVCAAEAVFCYTAENSHHLEA